MCVDIDPHAGQVAWLHSVVLRADYLIATHVYLPFNYYIIHYVLHYCHSTLVLILIDKPVVDATSACNLSTYVIGRFKVPKLVRACDRSMLDRSLLERATALRNNLPLFQI